MMLTDKTVFNNISGLFIGIISIIVINDNAVLRCA